MNRMIELKKHLVIGMFSLSFIFALASCTKDSDELALPKIKSAKEPSVDAAAAEYLGALADGTLDGYLKHENSYHKKANAAKQGIPSDMWAQREASLRETAKIEIRQNPYGLGSNECIAIVRQGATVKVKEVRPTPSGGWQVFYDISYGDQGKSPEIALQNGKPRLFRSGVFSVAFVKSVDGVPVAQSSCPAVGGTVATWPVPSLIADEAVRIANQAGALPTQLTVPVSRSASAPNIGQRNIWTEYITAAQLLKSTLEKHGWSVSDFQPKSMYYYDIGGGIEPPASAQKWIAGPVPEEHYIGVRPGSAYYAVLLEHAESKLLSFGAQEDTATATFSTQFSGCTAFCDLWKDLATMPREFGGSVFFGAYGKYNPSLDFDAVYNTTVNFVWSPSRGWYVQR